MGEHGLWVDEDVHEIVRDSVQARSPFQTVTKNHEERMTPSKTLF